jgi:FixJ family two-component response regulator
VNLSDICPMSATVHASNIHRKKPSPTEVVDGTPSALPIVFVVDDDATVREALELLVQSAGCLAETFASAEGFLSHPRVLAPSCLVLDVTLPDLNGLDLQERIAADRVDMPIIFVTGVDDISTTVRAMKAGAAEFLTKPCDYDVLLSAIRHAVDRSSSVLREEAEMGVLRNRYASLTPRERQVMDLVVTGELNKQVGGELGISEITVKAHRGNMMRKMGAGSLVDLVNMAARLRPPSVPNA